MKLDHGSGFNKEASMEVYRMFDIDDSGSIEFTELLDVMFVLSNTNTDLSGIPTMFFKLFSAGWDEDGDGKMQPMEFEHFMHFLTINDASLDGQEINNLRDLRKMIFNERLEVSSKHFHCNVAAYHESDGPKVLKKILQRMLAMILPEIESNDSLSMFRSGLNIHWTDLDSTYSA